MLNKEEIIKDVKGASRETLLKVIGKLVEMSNVKDEIIESQKIMICNLEVQNSILLFLVKDALKEKEKNYEID